MKKIYASILVIFLYMITSIIFPDIISVKADESIPRNFMNCEFGEDINSVRQKLTEKGTEPFNIKETPTVEICVMNPVYNNVKFNYAVFSFYENRLFSVRFCTVQSELKQVNVIFNAFKSLFDNLYSEGEDTNYPNLLIRTYKGNESVLQLTAESLLWEEKNTYQISINYSDPNVILRLLKFKSVHL